MGRRHVKTQAGIRVTQLQAKERQGLPATPEAGERPEKDSPSEPPEGTRPADTLVSDFWPPDCETTHFCHLGSLTESSPRTLLGTPPRTAHKPQPRGHTGQTEPSKTAKALTPELFVSHCVPNEKKPFACQNPVTWGRQSK